jgi:hypothetical protein
MDCSAGHITVGERREGYSFSRTRRPWNFPREDDRQAKEQARRLAGPVNCSPDILTSHEEILQ